MKLVGKLKSKMNLSSGMKNVAKISVGTMSGQAISLITLPLFTRVYGEKIIGVWAILNAIAIIVNSFSDLGLTNAIMIEENEDKMLRLYKVISTIVIFISLVAGLAVGGFYALTTNDLKLSVPFIVIYLFLGIFTLQQIQICYSWLNRKGMYNILMKNPLINNGVFGIIGLGLGLIGFKQYGYYIGWLSGQFITLIHMKRFLPKSFITFNIDSYKEIIKERRRFIQYQLPTNVISNFKNQLPVLLVTTFFGKSIVGYYSISVKCLNVPITFLANSMGRVYFKTVSEMKRAGKSIGEFTYRNLKKAMNVALIPMICLMAFGDVAVMIIFGKEFEMAGHIIRIVALQNFFTFLMMTVQGIGVTLEKQNYNMISCILQGIGFFTGLSIGKYVFNNIYIGLALMSMFFIIVNVTYFCMMFRVMKISWKRYLKNVSKNLILIIICAFAIRGLLFLVGVVSSI